jgi:aspartyl/asparaginyl beta-hydroxylase (cupin superfamily)
MAKNDNPRGEPSVLHDVDALVAAGQIAPAADLLDQRLADQPQLAAHPMPWMQLAGLRRALRQPHRALAAVDKALALAPRDFMALVMRATIVARTNPEKAGPAWHRALLQKPATALPPPMAAAVAAGEQVHAQWLATRESGMRDIAPAPDDDTDWRIRRFCDNALGKTRIYRSDPVAFFYPGLTEREYHPRSRFPWLSDLEAATPDIRAEMQALMTARTAQRTPYIQYGENEPLDQWRPLNHNEDWSALHLLKNGQRVEANAASCPVTMALLARLPQPVVAGSSPNAMFSLLAPHTAIPPHVGVSNTRLVCHLPLDIPAGCWFRVGAETRLWNEGEALVFDDTIEHEALNPSDRLRVVLIFDVWHPDLTPPECEAIAGIIASEMENGALD